MPRLLSGRVGLTSYSGLSTSRNQIVGGERPYVFPGSFEPSLDVPSINNQVLYADADGTRRWGAPGGAPTGVSSGISVEDEGLGPVGLGGSIAILNFVGDGVSVAQTFRLISGVDVGVATVTVPRIDFNAEDGQGFVQVTGISTIRVGAGLTVFAPSGTTGIATIGSLAELNLDVYDDRSFLSVTNVAQLQVGTGLSVTEPSANRAKFNVTGNFPNINISGISSIGQGFSTTMYTSGISTADAFIGITSVGAPNFYGNLTGDVTGDVTGNLTGDVYAGIVTATKYIDGNLNTTGVSTMGQVFMTTLDVTGVTTASGFVADVNGFLGAISHAGISTLTYLESTNINNSGILTTSALAGIDYIRGSGDNTREDIAVTVASKTGTHRYSGGSSNSFFLDGTEAPFLTLAPGKTYRFLQDNSTNSGHPLRFYYDAGKARAWSDTVTTNGTPGSANAYTDLEVTQETPSVLYYQCTNHNLMGNAVGSFTNLHYGDIDAVGIVTANSFVGPVTGDIIGDITGNVTGDLTGDVYAGIVTATGTYNGNFNATGVSTASFLQADTVNASGIVTAFSFSGTVPSSSLSGALPEVDGSALTNVNSATVALTATNTTNATHYVAFVDTATGNENVRTDTGLTYNPSSNTLSATFSGSLTGTATGLSGTPNITVGNITSNNILPAAHNTYDLGSNSVRFANIYSADLQLSNRDATPNSVDGTWGDWTLQEGEDDIFMINNRSGKKYKINLTEI